MFTGIVEYIGILSERKINTDGSGNIAVDVSGWNVKDFVIGESIAVNGVCLTLEMISKNHLLHFSILKETFGKSNLSLLPKGARVNLERAVRADGRFGGHFVTGHVDAVCPVMSLEKLGRDYSLRISCEENILNQIVYKGSVVVDGISLTVSAVDKKSFSVQLIPATIERTAIKERTKGKMINLETDILGKYVHKFLSSKAEIKSSVTMELLVNAGYSGTSAE
jgi:riboflavin synthase